MELKEEEKRLEAEWLSIMEESAKTTMLSPQRMEVQLSGTMTTENPANKDRQRRLEVVMAKMSHVTNLQLQQLRQMMQLADVPPATTRVPKVSGDRPNSTTGTLRSGKLYRPQSPKTAWLEQEQENMEGALSNHPATLCPLITKAQGQTQYVPWSFMDMVGLASRLPDLHEGANKWITALEESTAGVKLALGDIKALLMHIAGKHITEEILLAAQLPTLVAGNRADDVGFGGFRNQVWAELRKQYPEKMDPSKLDGEALKDGESPSKFLHDFQRKWRDETGSAWNANDTTKSLFKVMVKKAMPQEVQKRLDNVVGFMKMEWPLFSEHIVHHVENYRKEKQKEEEANKHLANKLTQLQLNELTKPKKEKAKAQAPVVTMDQAQSQSTVTMAPQTPTTPQTSVQPQVPQRQQQITPSNQSKS